MNPPTTTPTGNYGIVSTSGVQNEFNNASNVLNQLSGLGDQYASLFGQQIQGQQELNQLQEQRAISSATARTANQQNLANAQNAAALYGIRTAGAASGQSRYMPAATALQESAAQQSANFRFNQLDQQEKMAIAAANAARRAGDVKTLQSTIAYIKQAQQMKLQLAQYALAQQRFGFEQYKYANPSAYQNEMLGLAKGYGTPVSITQSPFQSLVNNIFGTHLGSTSEKVPGSSFNPFGGTAQQFQYSIGGKNYTFPNQQSLDNFIKKVNSK